MNKHLTDNNYLHIPNFISKEEANNLASELIEYSKLPGNLMTAGDPQAPSSLSMYNFLPFVKFLVKKIPDVSKILKEDALPTYTYTRIYTHGEVLNRHRDRPACEISLTLNLKKDTDWPIWFQKPNGEEISLELNQGDAVMYLGEIADHWRNAYQGQEHVQLFLHYVRAEGSKYWAVFDQLKQQPPTLEKRRIPTTII
jgi:hypothetical protein